MASLTEKISMASAVSGCEEEMRRLILDKLKTDGIIVDTMGTVIASKKGTDRKGKIMVATHMDECGFIVSGITDDGYLKFKPVGNIDINTVISKRVIVGKDRIKGIIGMKAIHLQTRDERENTTPASKLFIDIGAKSKKSAQKRVSPGDFVTFDTEYTQNGDIIKGKALSRCGIVPVLGCLDKVSGRELYFVFTAQKETGMRGAEAAARRIRPDAVITVGTAAADDMFGVEESTIKLGGGVVITQADRYAVYDRRLVNMAEALAKRTGIPYQTAVIKNEFSDAGAFAYGADGARCINISIPCRYAKTPVEMVSQRDIIAAELMLGMLIENIDEWTEGTQRWNF